VTSRPDLNRQPEPQYRSPWATWVVDRALEEAPRNPSEIQKAAFLSGLAQQLSDLREWDRYDRHKVPSVKLKESYRSTIKLQGHESDVISVHALPDGRIVSGSADYTVRVWRHGIGGKWRSEALAEHTGTVTVVQGLPDGRIVSGSADCTVRIWAPKVKGWEVETTLTLPSPVSCLQVLPDASVVTGHSNGNLIISRRSRTGRADQEFFEPRGAIYQLQVLPNNTMVTAHGDGSLMSWSRVNSAGWRFHTIHVSKYSLDTLHVLDDGRLYCASLRENIRELVPAENGTYAILDVGRHERRVQFLQALADGRIVSGGDDSMIRIWKPHASGEWQQTVLPGHIDSVRCLQVLPDGRIISGSADKTIRIWDGDPVDDRGAS